MKILDTSIFIVDPNDRRFFSSTEMHRATIDTIKAMFSTAANTATSSFILLAGAIMTFFWFKKKEEK